jgi:DHA1 family bicyclomycin/chloramphenicol resistance-like MFS transporter
MAMERDFFPVRETARIILMLILILGVSPLPAHTVGGSVAVRPGWSWVFLMPALAGMANLLDSWW